MHNKYIITYECYDNAQRMWKVVQLEKYFDFSLYSHHFSWLSLTSLLSAPEREVTSPSDFKVVGALNELKICRKHPWKILYKDCSFSSDPYKYCHHRQFLIGRFLNNLLLWNWAAKWTVIWEEAPMEDFVLSFHKAEWKVSDTGSVHWASSSFGHFVVCSSIYRFWLPLWYLQPLLIINIKSCGIPRYW
jgi:hypothetical protein